MMRTLRATGALAVLALGAVGGEAAAQVGANQGVLNPNRAGEEELTALPQLTPDLVRAIMQNRPFLSMQAFHDAVGAQLGDDARAALYQKLFVPINLNTASDAEILMVPGVGNRMLREFKEYRPYMALAQFRREIGKYVDDDEVARMEQYVFVPIDLNTASDDDILTIPGVGSRMLREFKEYRPYQNIEQFRREIGKYVDEHEVARLERYVEIRP
jgi:DNA uptake protein ComE-like DNA-binding protein